MEDLFKPKPNFDCIKLVMIISLIEKLSSGKDYIDFSTWVKNNHLTDKKILKAWADYNKEYGCSQKFRNFFLNETYITKAEQISLLKSVTYFIMDDNGTLCNVALFCYDKERCKAERFGCTFTSSEDCEAYKDDNIRKKGMKEFATFLYSMRNGFVHDANLIRLSEESMGTTALLWDFVPYKFHYISRNDYKGHVLMTLSVTSLEKIMDRNLKKLLDNYLLMRKSSR
ncbi:MAG: PAS domain-containing protein [Candidatus Bathyarchaeota archaeon]|nr:PAS domain-containing protein [Candidatus Bathyarchaeota archaeon]